MDSYPLTFILVTGLVLGICSGYVMHRADYCIAGMFRDLFLFNARFRLRTLLLLIIVSMLLFELSRQAGLLPLYPFPLIGSPSLANALGGLLFGTGMVLAGGCVVGTLYKMGSGSVTAIVAFAGLVAGSGLYAEIHPWWSSVIRTTTFFKGIITLPQLFGVDPLIPVLLSVFSASGYFYRVYRQGAWTRPVYAEGSIQPWKAAVFLAVAGTVSYILIGMPLGITTAYAKIAGYIESVLFAEHVQGLAYFALKPLDYVHPVTGTRLAGGPGQSLDAIALIQFPVIAGIFLGSAGSAIMLKEFKMIARLPLRQYVSAAVGGLIMGLASRMAPACNVWHLMGGLPIMAIQSILFLGGMVPGAYLGSRLLSRFVIR